MDQTLHRVAAKEREEIKRTTKQKMARRHNKEGKGGGGGGGGTTWIREATDRRQWKTLIDGYILQWMNKAETKENKQQDFPLLTVDSEREVHFFLKCRHCTCMHRSSNKRSD